MCTASQRKRFIMVYNRKLKALIRFINPSDAHYAALKTAEITTCINREEVFTNKKKQSHERYTINGTRCVCRIHYFPD